MTEVLIVLVAAAAVCVPIFIYGQRQYSKISYRYVIVKDWRKATYYPGKMGEKFTGKIAEQIYARDGYRCQEPGCSARLYEGIATHTKEYAMGLLLNAEPGNINHKHVPYHYGGPAIIENGEAMCQKHNIKRGKKIPRSAFKWLAERGETICLKKKDLLESE